MTWFSSAVRAGRVIPAAAVAFAAVAAASAAHPAEAGADPALAAIVERFDAAQKQIERISASFDEVKTIALLKDPVVQSGQFFHTKPDKFLWEYSSPEPKMLVLNGKEILAYYPKQKRAEEIQTRFTKKILKYMGLGAGLKDLQEEYVLALGRDNEVEGTDLLVLTPKSRQVGKRLAGIRIWVDRQTSQASRLEYVETDGDRTLITFHGVRINPEISLSKYEPQLPDDVTITNGINGFFAGSSR